MRNVKIFTADDGQFTIETVGSGDETVTQVNVPTGWVTTVQNRLEVNELTTQEKAELHALLEVSRLTVHVDPEDNDIVETQGTTYP